MNRFGDIIRHLDHRLFIGSICQVEGTEILNRDTCILLCVFSE